MKKEDRLPKWMSIGIFAVCLISFIVVAYITDPLKILDTQVQPIGKYYDREMTEKIDQDNNNGMLPMHKRQVEIIIYPNGSGHTVIS